MYSQCLGCFDVLAAVVYEYSFFGFHFIRRERFYEYVGVRFAYIHFVAAKKSVEIMGYGLAVGAELVAACEGHDEWVGVAQEA